MEKLNKKHRKPITLLRSDLVDFVFSDKINPNTATVLRYKIYTEGGTLKLYVELHCVPNFITPFDILDVSKADMAFHGNEDEEMGKYTFKLDSNLTEFECEGGLHKVGALIYDIIFTIVKPNKI